MLIFYEDVSVTGHGGIIGQFMVALGRNQTSLATGGECLYLACVESSLVDVHVVLEGFYQSLLNQPCPSTILDTKFKQ